MNIQQVLELPFRLALVSPNMFLVVVLVFGLLCIGSVYCFFILWKRIIGPWITRQMMIRPSLVFTVVFLLMVLTRFGITYLNSQGVIRAPESLIAMDTVGRDLLDGVIKPTILLIQGKPFNPHVGYGGGIAVLTSPILLFLNQYHICSITDPLSCNRILYPIVLLLTIGGFIAFVFIIDKKKRHTVPFLLLLTTFLLGLPGTLGLDRGNVDIFFALLLGVLAYILSKHSNGKSSYVLSFVIGIISGYLVNAKFFFFPYIVVLLYASPSQIVAFVSGALSFLFFSYGSLLYGVRGSIFDSYEASRVFITVSKSYGGIVIPTVNHSLESIASIATSCVAFLNCRQGENKIILPIISTIVFIFIFISPFMRTCLAFTRSLIRNSVSERITWMNVAVNTVKKMITLSHKRNIFLVSVLIMINALINLVPTISFDYRLYYSIPLLFLFVVSVKNKRSISYAYTALLFLCLKSLWINLDVYPFGWWPFEARGMNFFLILHFYFSMKALAVELEQLFADWKFI